MQKDRPILKNRQAFEEILSHYHVSGHAKSVLAATPFVVLSGIAGGGRNTVIRYLIANYNYGFIVSDTTRPPKLRDGRMEENGVDYYFRNEDDLLEDLRQGEFVEAELIHNQQVSGTSIREVQRIAAMGKIPISDYEFGGANAIADAKPDATIIGLLPPNYDEWLRRLSGRETMHHEEFIDRLATAKKVLENMLSKDYFKYVVNDNFAHSAEAICQIVEHGNYSSEVEQHGRAVAKELLQKINQALVKQ